MAKLKKKESKRGNDSSTPSYAKRKGKEKAKAVKFVDKIKQSEIKNEIAGLSTFLSQVRAHGLPCSQSVL